MNSRNKINCLTFQEAEKLASDAKMQKIKLLIEYEFNKQFRDPKLETAISQIVQYIKDLDLLKDGKSQHTVINDEQDMPLLGDQIAEVMEHN